LSTDGLIVVSNKQAKCVVWTGFDVRQCTTLEGELWRISPG